MNHLFNSGNFAGFIGLALIVFVGIRLAKEGQIGGWLLAGGASLFAFSQIFRMYIEPLCHEPLHLTYSPFMITFVTALGAITSSLGFVMMPLGLVLLAVNNRSQVAPAATYDSASLGTPLAK